MALLRYAPFHVTKMIIRYAVETDAKRHYNADDAVVLPLTRFFGVSSAHLVIDSDLARALDPFAHGSLHADSKYSPVTLDPCRWGRDGDVSGRWLNYAEVVDLAPARRSLVRGEALPPSAAERLQYSKISQAMIKDWHLLCKNLPEARPHNIPARPNQVYGDDGFTWAEFLGVVDHDASGDCDNDSVSVSGDSEDNAVADAEDESDSEDDPALRRALRESAQYALAGGGGGSSSSSMSGAMGGGMAGVSTEQQKGKIACEQKLARMRSEESARCVQDGGGMGGGSSSSGDCSSECDSFDEVGGGDTEDAEDADADLQRALQESLAAESGCSSSSTFSPLLKPSSSSSSSSSSPQSLSPTSSALPRNESKRRSGKQKATRFYEVEDEEEEADAVEQRARAKAAEQIERDGQHARRLVRMFDEEDEVGEEEEDAEDEEEEDEDF